MSLNNISLSSQLLADLYSHSLVQKEATAILIEAPIPFLGKNEKNILILVNKEGNTYLEDKELDFLTAVLSACGLALSHVAIVNKAKLKDMSLPKLVEQFSPNHLLLLDVKAEELLLPQSEFYTVQKHHSFEFIIAPSLAQIEKTKQAKSQLWVSLKQLFRL